MKDALPFQTQQPIFSKMGGISELSHMNSEERRKYFNSLNKYRTNLSVMEYAIEEGLEKGIAQGRAEGIGIGERKNQLATAKQMKADNLPIDMIQKYTGLTEEEINAL